MVGFLDALRQTIPGFIEDNAGLAAVHNDPAPSPGHQLPPQRRQNYANVVAAALSESMREPLPCAVGFFFGNAELGMEVWKARVVFKGQEGYQRSNFLTVTRFNAIVLLVDS